MPAYQANMAQPCYKENNNPNALYEVQSNQNYCNASEFGDASESFDGSSAYLLKSKSMIHSVYNQSEYGSVMQSSSHVARPLSVRMNQHMDSQIYARKQERGKKSIHYLNDLSIAQKRFINKPVFKVVNDGKMGKIAKYDARKNYIAQNFGMIDPEAIQAALAENKNKMVEMAQEEAPTQSCNVKHNFVLNKTRTTCAQPQMAAPEQTVWNVNAKAFYPK